MIVKLAVKGQLLYFRMWIRTTLDEDFDKFSEFLSDKCEEVLDY